MGQIAQFAGLPTDPDRILNAVQRADLENMRKIERQRWQAKGLGVPDETSSFYRSGQSKNWEMYFTPELLRRFLSYSEQAMWLAGYYP